MTIATTEATWNVGTAAMGASMIKKAVGNTRKVDTTNIAEETSDMAKKAKELEKGWKEITDKLNECKKPAYTSTIVSASLVCEETSFLQISPRE